MSRRTDLCWTDVVRRESEKGTGDGVADVYVHFVYALKFRVLRGSIHPGVRRHTQDLFPLLMSSLRSSGSSHRVLLVFRLPSLDQCREP